MWQVSHEFGVVGSSSDMGKRTIGFGGKNEGEEDLDCKESGGFEYPRQGICRIGQRSEAQQVCV
jgi:hypothetical protein